MGSQQPQPSNKASSGTDKRQHDRPARENEHQPQKLSATFFHCNKKGHKSTHCRKRKKELAQNDPLNPKPDGHRPQRT